MTDDLVKRLRMQADATRRRLLQERTNLYDEAADELERLTPTEEDIATARQIVSVGRLMDPDCKSDALLRKYVLGEKT